MKLALLVLELLKSGYEWLEKQMTTTPLLRWKDVVAYFEGPEGIPKAAKSGFVVNIPNDDPTSGGTLYMVFLSETLVPVFAADGQKYGRKIAYQSLDEELSRHLAEGKNSIWIKS